MPGVTLTGLIASTTQQQDQDQPPRIDFSLAWQVRRLGGAGGVDGRVMQGSGNSMVEVLEHATLPDLLSLPRGSESARGTPTYRSNVPCWTVSNDGVTHRFLPSQSRIDRHEPSNMTTYERVFQLCSGPQPAHRRVLFDDRSSMLLAGLVCARALSPGRDGVDDQCGMGLSLALRYFADQLNIKYPSG